MGTIFNSLAGAFVGSLFFLSLFEVLKTAKLHRLFKENCREFKNEMHKYSLKIPVNWEFTERDDGVQFTYPQGQEKVNCLEIHHYKLSKESEAKDKSLLEIAEVILLKFIKHKMNADRAEDFKSGEYIGQEKPPLLFLEGTLNQSWHKFWLFPSESRVILLYSNSKAMMASDSAFREKMELVLDSFRLY